MKRFDILIHDSHDRNLINCFVIFVCQMILSDSEECIVERNTSREREKKVTKKKIKREKHHNPKNCVRCSLWMAKTKPGENIRAKLNLIVVVSLHELTNLHCSIVHALNDLYINRSVEWKNKKQFTKHNTQRKKKKIHTKTDLPKVSISCIGTENEAWGKKVFFFVENRRDSSFARIHKPADDFHFDPSYIYSAYTCTIFKAHSFVFSSLWNIQFDILISVGFGYVLNWLNLMHSEVTVFFSIKINRYVLLTSRKTLILLF